MGAGGTTNIQSVAVHIVSLRIGPNLIGTIGLFLSYRRRIFHVPLYQLYILYIVFFKSCTGIFMINPYFPCYI